MQSYTLQTRDIGYGYMISNMKLDNIHQYSFIIFGMIYQTLSTIEITTKVVIGLDVFQNKHMVLPVEFGVGIKKNIGLNLKLGK